MTVAFKFGAHSTMALIGINPSLDELVRRGLRRSEVDFMVWQGRRTAAQQLAYYNAGKSKIKSGGRHQFGCAVDVIAIDPVSDKPVYVPVSLYRKINAAFARASKELGIPYTWGGTFKTLKDYGHFELPKSYAPDNWQRKKVA